MSKKSRILLGISLASLGLAGLLAIPLFADLLGKHVKLEILLADGFLLAGVIVILGSRHWGRKT